MTSAVDTIREELERKRREVQGLEQALALLSGDAILIADERGSVPRSTQDFKGLGITDAAKRFILEAGEPKGTVEIAQELLRRGMETNAKNFVATVYSTLDNASDFKRTGSGRKGKWEIKDSNKRG